MFSITVNAHYPCHEQLMKDLVERHGDRNVEINIQFNSVPSVCFCDPTNPWVADTKAPKRKVKEDTEINTVQNGLAEAYTGSLFGRKK